MPSRSEQGFTADACIDLFLFPRNTPPADKTDRENNTFVGVCCGGVVRNPQHGGGGGGQEMECEASYLHFTLACVLMVNWSLISPQPH